MATDITEIIGSAIAIKFLFNIPLIIGILITSADVLILLLLMKMGFRKVEAIVATDQVLVGYFPCCTFPLGLLVRLPVRC